MEKPIMSDPDPVATGEPAAASSPAESPRISIEDFAKVDLRVGEVLEAERVSGSKKLIRMLVDIGEEKRQIVAGIGECYQPEALLHRKVVIVANLEPRKLMGVESNGMIVAAANGPDPVLVSFSETVTNGSRLR